MSTIQLIEKEIASLPEPLQREVYDFARFLRIKAQDEHFDGLLVSEAVLARDCQQTAEKAVKAFFVFKEPTPEKTHDIRRLTIEAAAHEPRFNELMELAVSLTPYAGEFR